MKIISNTKNYDIFILSQSNDIEKYVKAFM